MKNGSILCQIQKSKFSKSQLSQKTIPTLKLSNETCKKGKLKEENKQTRQRSSNKKVIKQ